VKYKNYTKNWHKIEDNKWGILRVDNCSIYMKLYELLKLATLQTSGSLFADWDPEGDVVSMLAFRLFVQPLRLKNLILAGRFSLPHFRLFNRFTISPACGKRCS